MNTGMPNGRAIRTPAAGSRDPPSGALPATRRCYVLERDNRCRDERVLLLFADTPAIRNQYGEMYTGMPKGRATRTPGLCSCAPPSGALPATRRCYVLERVTACPVGAGGSFRPQDMPV